MSLLITDLNWVGLKARINDLLLSTKEHLQIEYRNSKTKVIIGTNQKKDNTLRSHLNLKVKKK